jgi:hypothetical protein
MTIKIIAENENGNDSVNNKFWMGVVNLRRIQSGSMAQYKNRSVAC